MQHRAYNINTTIIGVIIIIIITAAAAATTVTAIIIIVIAAITLIKKPNAWNNGLVTRPIRVRTTMPVKYFGYVWSQIILGLMESNVYNVT